MHDELNYPSTNDLCRNLVFDTNYAPTFWALQKYEPLLRIATAARCLRYYVITADMSPPDDRLLLNPSTFYLCSLPRQPPIETALADGSLLRRAMHD